MELTVYSIIKKRIITEKSGNLYRKSGKLTFEVNKEANKIMIRQAVEKIWDVKVENVRVITCPGKKKVFGKRSFKSPNRKKAIITLKKGYKIDLPGHFETMGIASQSPGEKETALEGK